MRVDKIDVLPTEERLAPSLAVAVTLATTVAGGGNEGSRSVALLRRLGHSDNVEGSEGGEEARKSSRVNVAGEEGSGEEDPSCLTVLERNDGAVVYREDGADPRPGIPASQRLRELSAHEDDVTATVLAGEPEEMRSPLEPKHPGATRRASRR